MSVLYNLFLPCNGKLSVVEIPLEGRFMDDVKVYLSPLLVQTNIKLQERFLCDLKCNVSYFLDAFSMWLAV